MTRLSSRRIGKKTTNRRVVSPWSALVGVPLLVFTYHAAFAETEDLAAGADGKLRAETEDLGNGFLHHGVATPVGNTACQIISYAIPE